MLIKDFIRQLNAYKKKEPEASVYLFGDLSDDVESVSKIALAYAEQSSLTNKTLSAENIYKTKNTGLVPVIVIG